VDFSTLQTEFFARGFADLNDAGAGLVRAKRWLNESYQDVCERYDWPFLEVSTTPGAAPVTISDLRKIIDVTDSTNDRDLTFISRATLGDAYPDLPDTGNGLYYWLDGLTTLRVYPVNTSTTISVRYLKIPADLSGGTDTPLIPTRFQNAIVELAAAKGFRQRDNYEAAGVAQGEGERVIAQMRDSLLDRTFDSRDAASEAAMYLATDS
jgi:hypothetical protein